MRKANSTIPQFLIPYPELKLLWLSKGDVDLWFNSWVKILTFKIEK